MSKSHSQKNHNLKETMNMAAPSASIQFSTVKAILDKAIAGWTTKHGGPPNLGIHSGDFGWDTKQQLSQATAFGLQLIDPSMVGNGQGGNTNLVQALIQGAQGFPRMPDNGPYLSQDDINVIIKWIDAGMPD